MNSEKSFYYSLIWKKLSENVSIVWCLEKFVVLFESNSLKVSVMFHMNSLKMCLLLFSSNSLKVWVLFDMNSEKVFSLN